jgi:hypothetical protein
MNVQRDFLLLVTLAAMACPAAAQQAASPAPTKVAAHSTAEIPDFSGVWRHGSLPWFEPPESGPAPVTNLSRRNGVSNYDQLVGDYNNPILQPWAAEVVKRYGKISLAGVTFPSPSNQCWPEPVPYIFKHGAMQVLQQNDKITILYNENHEIRWIRLNEPHPSPLKPSWHGDSVGHYEGDTLVIDTTGVNPNRPYPMIDLFGTPYTKALHVVERYRLLDYAEAKGALERGDKELMRNGGPLSAGYTGKYLQIHLTVEDEGAFTTPWTTTITYAKDTNEWREVDCAENRHEYYNSKESDVPRANRSDF